MPVSIPVTVSSRYLRRAGLALGVATGLLAGAVVAQPMVRCGQTYTNVPPAGQVCELLPEQAVTVIEGTRVRTAPEAGRQVPGAGGAAVASSLPASAAASSMPSAMPSARPTARVPDGAAALSSLAPGAVPAAPSTTPSAASAGAATPDRETLAREVLRHELERTRERLLGLQQARDQQAASANPDSGHAQALEQALARTWRDLQSLQRELDRREPGGRR